MKRGQITLFVLVGIVIIAILGFTYFLIQQSAKTKSLQGLTETAQLSESELDAKHTVESCLEDLLSNGILEVFSKGGTLENVDKAEAAGIQAPVYKLGLPRLDSITEQIGFYIDNNMETCIRKNSNLEISKSGITEVNARNGEVTALSTMSIVIPEGSILTDFQAKVDADLEKVMEYANELYLQEKDTGRFVAFANFSRNAVEKDYLLYTESTAKEKLYLISFKNILIEGRQLEFAFAIPIEERTIVAGMNITEVDTGIFPIFTGNSGELEI